MRKFLFVGLISLLLIGCGSAVHAQTTGINEVKPATIIAPDILPPNSNPNILGQDHRYTVTFRGNGEAVVSVRLVFSNMTDSALSTLSFRVPKTDPQDIIAFQVLQEPQCIRFQPLTAEDKQKGIYQPTCQQYQEPDFYNYWGGSAKYQKASHELNSDTIVVTLPRPVQANRNGSILLYYRGFGYAKKNLFGAFDYSFETLKVEDKIQNLTVGVSTDSDLYLKGTKGQVNYRFDDSFATMKMESAGLAAPTANVAFDRMYSMIGQGTITKTASNLQPLDSYTVKGSYADSWLKLYAPWVIIGIVAFLLVVLCIVAVIRWIIKRLSVRTVKTQTQTATAVSGSTLAFLEICGVSFLSTFLIILYTFCLIFIQRVFQRTFPYDAIMLMTVLLLILSLAIYGILFFAPAIFIGLRRGFAWGLGTVGLAIFWLIIFIVLFLVVVLGLGFSSYGRVLPMLGTESSGVAGYTAPAFPQQAPAGFSVPSTAVDDIAE